MSKQTDTLDAIRERQKALANWQPYDAKTTRELQEEIERRAIIDITFLLAKIDADDDTITELQEQLIKAKDWSSHYFAETIRLEKIIDQGREIVEDFGVWRTFLDGKVKSECCGVVREIETEYPFQHIPGCKLGKWQRANG